MAVMDRMALVLAGTLLVCAASAAPERASSGAAAACDLLRLPTTDSAAADRLARRVRRSLGPDTAVVVAVAPGSSMTSSRPGPASAAGDATSTCTVTGDGITVTLQVWHYAGQRDAARRYQGWDCDGDRRRITVAPMDHGCVWGSRHIFGLGNRSAEVSLGEAEVMVGPTVLRATVVCQGVATNALALVTEVVTVAAERLHRR